MFFFTFPSYILCTLLKPQQLIKLVIKPKSQEITYTYIKTDLSVERQTEEDKGSVSGLNSNKPSTVHKR